jgi:hypothetical protein
MSAACLLFIVIILNFLPAVIGGMGFDLVAFFLEDLQILAAVLAAYFLCPFRFWRLKTLAMISVLIILSGVIHNSTLYLGVLPENMPAMYSIALQAVLFGILTALMTIRYSFLPDQEITPGEIYEVIGRPKSNWHFLSLILTLGRGYDFSLTDGVHIWKFSKINGRLIEEDYHVSFISGKKCVPSGIDINKVRNKIGSKWSIFNNCLTTFRLGI